MKMKQKKVIAVLVASFLFCGSLCMLGNANVTNESSIPFVKDDNAGETDFDQGFEVVDSVSTNQVVMAEDNDFDLVRYNISSQTTDFVNINDTVAFSVQNDDEETILTDYDPTYNGEIDSPCLEGGTISPFEQMASNSSMQPVTDFVNTPFGRVVHLLVEYSVYNYETKIYDTLRVSGTGYFVGSNVLLSAGHLVLDDLSRTNEKGTAYEDNITNPVFPEKVYIYPRRHYENNTDIKPYGEIEVSQIYIQKEYYQNRASNIENLTVDAFSFDWCALVIEEEIGLETGYLGLYSQPNGSLIRTVGYLKGTNANEFNMMYSSGNITSTSSEILEYNAATSDGFSGGPIAVANSFYSMSAGIHVGSAGDTGYAKRITPLIIDLIRNLRRDHPVKIKNFYYDGSDMIQYNCVTSIIYLTDPDYILQLKRIDTGNYVTVNVSKQEFYSSTIYSPEMNAPYSHYKIIRENTASDDIEIDYKYYESETAAKYSVTRRSASGSTISTSFDQNGNVWDHGGSSSDMIKGTVVYNGEARNIEVDIPLLGTKTSSEIEVGGVVFQLRVGPNRVSIKADSSVICTNNTAFFAFATVS